MVSEAARKKYRAALRIKGVQGASLTDEELDRLIRQARLRALIIGCIFMILLGLAGYLVARSMM